MAKDRLRGTQVTIRTNDAEKDYFKNVSSNLGFDMGTYFILAFMYTTKHASKEDLLEILPSLNRRNEIGYATKYRKDKQDD